MLVTVFTSLLPAQERHDAQTHQQIVHGMCEDTRKQAPGLLIDPGPQEAAPQHTYEADEPVAVGDGKDARAHECGRKEAELAAQDGKEQPTKCKFFKDRCEGDVFHEADSRQRGRAPD